ncbi:hypothetical protein [Brumimicrobium aurantiacum]|uniref:Uncharacterized protein n=1 Tax=Brumimicrobium aurantiacum TaxID=1737063 RepID=A0A3E1F1I9_9FLAO|nr:hypothetical protein [Brumimicrobium aurantiacum]RFC55587.1 hypothetical protein DXU93_01255 [Brumimicrobium aurantiacum]
MKKILLMTIALCLVSALKAQVISTNVASKVHFGTYTYYFLESNTDDIYKTSAFPDDVLAISQYVELRYNSDKETYDITIPELDHQGTASLESGSTPPVSEIYWEDLDMPAFSNNMLHFDDSLHAVNFFIQLDSIFSHYNQSDFDSIALAFHEHYSDYVSFWMYLDAKYHNDDDGLDYDTFLALEEEEFISDPVQQLLVSDKRLVRIDDRVFYYNDLNQIVSTEFDNYAAIEFLDSVSELEDFDIYDPFSTVLNNADFELPYHYEYFPFNNLPTPYDDRVPGDGDGNDDGDSPLASIVYVGFDDPNQIRYTSYVITDNAPNDCDPNTKVLSVILKRGEREYWDSNGDGNVDHLDQYDWVDLPYYFDASNNAELTVDWDDGSAIEVFQNYSYGEGKYHFYSNLGTYYPTTTLTLFIPEENQAVTFVDGTNAPNTDADHFTFVNNGLLCSNAEKQRWNHKEDGDYRLRTKIWVNNNFFGKHFGAYTQMWKKNAFGNFNNKKADAIVVNIIGTFRNDQDCTVNTTKSGSKTRSNKKEARKSKSKVFDDSKWAIGNEDIYSYHYFFNGGTTILHNMILNLCE